MKYLFKVIMFYMSPLICSRIVDQLKIPYIKDNRRFVVTLIFKSF